MVVHSTRPVAIGARDLTSSQAARHRPRTYAIAVAHKSVSMERKQFVQHLCVDMFDCFLFHYELVSLQLLCSEKDRGEGNCNEVCQPWSAATMAARRRQLGRVLPDVKLMLQDARLLHGRRCRACHAVAGAVAAMPASRHLPGLSIVAMRHRPHSDRQTSHRFALHPSAFNRPQRHLAV